MPAETLAAATDLIGELSGKSICFAGNSHEGRGGQGEFLRLMVYALDHLAGATIYSRSAAARIARSVSLTPTALPFRGRPELFDGVVGQCCRTLERLRVRGTQLVLTCLNTHIDNFVEVLENEHRALNYRGHHSVHPWMRRRSLREIELADWIRVNSEFAKQTFVDRGVPDSKIRVIQPGIDLNHFHPTVRKDGVFRVLAVASIDARKGIHYLLTAFEEAKIPRSELLLVGGTGDRWSKEMLRGFLKRNANIRQCLMDVTTVPADESYGCASVLVHPALEDGYALVIPQALACGTPVIVTRSSGASELIEDGRNGFVIDSRSVGQIRDRLQLLANDRSLLQTMSRNAPDSVRHLGYPDFVYRLLSFYQDVLDERN